MTSDKAPDAFRTISEAAEDLDLPQHVLRFWETRFSQIKPLKRGGGRRYYRPDDVEFLRGLKHLLHAERYTIKGVQKIIKEQGVKAVQSAWKDSPTAAPAEKPPAPAPVLATSTPSAPLPASASARLEAALAELMDCRRMITSFRQA
jgi:DNA-binding transcriptional MerR regulator